VPELSNGGKMSKTFLIAGDSWACGEWGYNKTRDGSLTHPGLGQFMCDHDHLAINVGVPGGSNSQTAKQVKDFLTHNKQLEISAVLVFQTEWPRDTKFQKLDFVQQCISQGYAFLRDQLITNFYEQLSTLSLTFNVPVWLIGGCSDTWPPEQIDGQFPGVQVLCQSMTNLLLDKNHLVTNPVYSYNLTPITEYKKKFSSNDLEFLIQDIEKGIQRQKLWESSQRYFFPDILHPNRKGHKILFDLAKQRLIEND
jgi:hypothetical protein